MKTVIKRTQVQELEKPKIGMELILGWIWQIDTVPYYEHTTLFFLGHHKAIQLCSWVCKGVLCTISEQFR